MLLNDGTYKIYCIQHRDSSGWAYSNFDVFGYPPGFNASGMCWQRTGVHGVFDFKEARHGLSVIRRRNPKTKFRIVCVGIVQTTTAVVLKTKDKLCRFCGQPMKPKNVRKKPGEFDHAQNCLYSRKRRKSRWSDRRRATQVSQSVNKAVNKYRSEYFDSERSGR